MWMITFGRWYRWHRWESCGEEEQCWYGTVENNKVKSCVFWCLGDIFEERTGETRSDLRTFDCTVTDQFTWRSSGGIARQLYLGAVLPTFQCRARGSRENEQSSIKPWSVTDDGKESKLLIGLAVPFSFLLGKPSRVVVCVLHIVRRKACAWYGYSLWHGITVCVWGCTYRWYVCCHAYILFEGDEERVVSV